MFNFLTVSTLITVKQSDYCSVLKTPNKYSFWKNKQKFKAEKN